MIRFKKFVTLLEGGNVVGKVHKIRAAPFSNQHRQMLHNDIRQALRDLHDHVYSESDGQIHMFGQNAAALDLPAEQGPFTGSSRHFMDRNMSAGDYSLLKPEGTTGDIDVQYMPHPDVKKLLLPERRVKTTKGVKTISYHGGIPIGTKLGPFTVADLTGAGDTVHVVLNHPKVPNPIQLDLEKSPKQWENNIPGAHNTDPFSSDRNDLSHPEGPFKGVHHKHLISMAAKAHPEQLKYAMKGLKQRDASGSSVGLTEHGDVSEKLFGVREPKKMSSFTGVVDLIKKHYTPEQHQTILDDANKEQYALPEHVKSYLHKHLGTLTEETQREHHVATTVMTGVDPFTHMGHVNDIGKLVHDLGGGFFAMSAKSSFPHDTRQQIFSKQAGHARLNVHPIIVKENDQIIANAWDNVKDKEGKKVLHLVAGQDRQSMAERIANGMRSGKIKNPGFHEIRVHTPTGEERSHGMSGTKMRTAASTADIGTFHKHLGPAFTKEEAMKHMQAVQDLLKSGQIKLKRR